MEINRTLFLLIALSLSCGCSTIATLSAGAEPTNFNCRSNTIPRVYSGVVNDWNFVTSDTPGNSVAILDIPFSLVADTLALPYTIYLQNQYGNLCNGNDSCDVETYDCEQLEKQEKL